MKKIVILLSQSYLHFASESVLNYLHNNTRMVLIIHKSEDVHPLLKGKIDKVYSVDGQLTESLRPELNFSQVEKIINEEIQIAGSSQEISIFCQQEDNVLTAAKLRDMLNIPGDNQETVIKFRDKIAMKKCVAETLPHAIPKYEKLDLNSLNDDPVSYYEMLEKKLGSKMLVKPTSGAGSFNVMIINTPDDLKKCQNMILNDEHTFAYEIDEYISGTMYQCDSFIRDGKVLFSGILELGCTNFDFVQGKPLSVFPVTEQRLYDKLFDYNQTVINALGFSSGSTHHELFINDRTQEIIFLEIAARVPGGLGVPFHTANSDINLIDATLLLAADSQEVDNIHPDIRNNMVSALLPVGHGKVISLNEPEISSHYHIDWYIKVGEEVNSRSLIDTAGILIFKNEDSNILRRDFEKLQFWTPVTCA
ncbi:acetyl-CoA carboxylase biotin carboxylase subunit family protein [Pantoea sp. CCBC3-3-1]|uniref:ATP-grasp domain-containing protein n=1 Tax=Pantoea sp. CCBC3-3-1 TaxID=2490851 RepID=UPI0011BF996C|nr:ATP-grasp domain-containing protein [Pantoea sp. CCBC3-3-1]